MIRASNDFRSNLKSSVSFRRVAGIGALLALPLLASPALANPIEPRSRPVRRRLRVHQTRRQSIRRAKTSSSTGPASMSAAGQTTQFAQPNAQAIAVNRIGGNSASYVGASNHSRNAKRQHPTKWRPPGARAHLPLHVLHTMKQISIIIPALNEAESIGHVVSLHALASHRRVHRSRQRQHRRHRPNRKQPQARE